MTTNFKCANHVGTTVPCANCVPVVEEVEAPEDDTLPLTKNEFIEAGQEIIDTVKHGLFVPMYKLGRRYIRGARGAADQFFDGVANDKEKK